MLMYLILGIIKLFMHIFVDISANPQKKVSVGCYLILENLNIDTTGIKDLIQSVQLTSATSTDAELELIDFVLATMKPQENQIFLYTDCHNFHKLFTNKCYQDRFDPANSRSGKAGSRRYAKDHHNALLYEKLLNHIRRLNLIVVKATGHSKKELQKTVEQQIFAIIDKTARKIMRNMVKELNQI